MKVQTPQIAWHNRDRVSSVSIQPFAYPTPCKEGGTRIATGGDDTHVVVSDIYLIKFLCSKILPTNFVLLTVTVWLDFFASMNCRLKQLN